MRLNKYLCVFRSGRMRWVGHVTLMGAKRNLYGVYVGRKPKERDRLKDLGLHGTEILNWILGMGWEAWTGFTGLAVATHWRLLWTRQWTLRFPRMRWIFWAAEELCVTKSVSVRASASVRRAPAATSPTQLLCRLRFWALQAHSVSWPTTLYS
jgi:hypothetical protein